MPTPPLPAPLLPPGAEPGAGPRFDVPVPPDGYAWWYLDALSDDGREGLTVIAFVGSVFSPYYAAARRRGPADPEDYCALNVGLHGPGGTYWAMTERRRTAIARTADRFAVGPSAVAWDGKGLTVTVDEIAVPLPRRLVGTIRLEAETTTRLALPLDAAGRHLWTPYAPRARVAVDFAQPARRWSGAGYFDGNAGREPLERSFARWTWDRTVDARATAVTYDVLRRDGTSLALALEFARDGGVAAFAPPAPVALPKTLWRIPRAVRSDPGTPPRVVGTLVDAPFYARSTVAVQRAGVPGLAMHESLDLDRFAARWVQALLPFRMPRPTRG